jgi:hypothetical protein
MQPSEPVRGDAGVAQTRRASAAAAHRADVAGGARERDPQCGSVDPLVVAENAHRRVDVDPDAFEPAVGPVADDLGAGNRSGR